MTARRLTDRSFFDLLRTRTRRDARRLDAEIVARHATPLTILAADSAGFSRKTFEHGVITFLANMTESYDGVIPLIERRGGIVLTRNADNILAVFDEPASAARAALETHRWLARRNARVAAADRFELCIGIHHGEVLRLRDNVYGAAVNVCAKIGEDLASANETLVTREVARRIEREFVVESARSTEIGGTTVELYRVVSLRR